jgi:hypothetical protein
LVQWLGQWTDRLSTRTMVLVAGIAAVATGLLSGLLIHSPGLSEASVTNRVVVSIYGVVLLVGLFAALARRHTPLVLFAGSLLSLGAANNLLGCAPLFDGLRVTDYAAIAGLVALFAPGLTARWSNRTFTIGIALLILLASGLRMASSHERLFAHTQGELAAAHWVSTNLPEYASVATDAKMSLLLLGAANRNATYEGTWWLFTDQPITPYIAVLNRGLRFFDRPIQFVLLSDYMFERGAEVTWFSPAMKASESLPERLDTIGEQVYDQDGVTIWELDASAVAAGALEEGRVNFMQGFTSTVSSLFSGGPCR